MDVAHMFIKYILSMIIGDTRKKCSKYTHRCLMNCYVAGGIYTMNYIHIYHLYTLNCSTRLSDVHV